jgi:hypothetical protein
VCGVFASHATVRDCVPRQVRHVVNGKVIPGKQIQCGYLGFTLCLYGCTNENATRRMVHMYDGSEKAINMLHFLYFHHPPPFAPLFIAVIIDRGLDEWKLQQF